MQTDAIMVKNNIKSLRIQRGINQETLAEEIGISRESLSAMENGHTSLVNKHVEPLAKALSTTPMDVIGYQIPGEADRSLKDTHDRYKERIDRMQEDHERELQEKQRENDILKKENESLRAQLESTKKALDRADYCIKMYEKQLNNG